MPKNTDKIVLLEQAVDELKDHARVANDEMGKVQTHLASLETDVKWIKESVDRVDARVWWILGTVVAGTLIQIILKWPR